MTRLYLVRHGDVDAVDLFYGHLDLSLSPRGVTQLQTAARTLAEVNIDAVYCSDLQRAVQSARLIAEPHGLSPVERPAFREMKMGDLEGTRRSDLLKLHPELKGIHYSDMYSYRFPGGGENLQDVAARVQPELESMLWDHTGHTIVLVAHNSVNRVILGHALGLSLERVFDFKQQFGCINCIDYGERIRVGVLNWTPDAPTS